MKIRHIIGHNILSGITQVSDAYGKQLCFEGNAVEVTDPTPAQLRLQHIAELRKLAARKPESKSAGRVRLTKSEILSLYKRDWNGSAYAYSKPRSITK